MSAPNTDPAHTDLARTDSSCAATQGLIDQLQAVDWSAPWWNPWRKLALQGLAHLRLGATVADTLNALAIQAEPGPEACPVRFVPQAMLPPARAYEDFIFETRQVPTRDNAHDFFNGLCWLRLPRSKQRLNILQAAEIERLGVGAARGRLRDALTLFDENAALIWGPTTALEALRERRWHEALVVARQHWPLGSVWVFGHAALEKLMQPYLSITAHGWPLPLHSRPTDEDGQEGPGAVAALDEALAQSLAPERLVQKPFLPLPLLGVPHWWAANEASAFYDQTEVFRPLLKVLSS